MTIQYQGPPINENVPWEVRHHLQLIYEKLGVSTQAFTLIKQQMDEMQAQIDALQSKT